MNCYEFQEENQVATLNIWRIEKQCIHCIEYLSTSVGHSQNYFNNCMFIPFGKMMEGLRREKKTMTVQTESQHPPHAKGRVHFCIYLFIFAVVCHGPDDVLTSM